MINQGNVLSVNEKLDKLSRILREMNSAVVAFSGGVDSTTLLSLAHEVLKGRVLAATACSPTYTSKEMKQAEKLAENLGIRHIIIKTHELEDPVFITNPDNRCYLCKKELFTVLKELAFKEGLDNVIEGSNVDDINDYRPGLAAIKELKIRSPFIEANITKEEIRMIARQRKLSVWDKPAMACLASRIPYGEEITEKRLRRIETAEEIIHSFGIKNARVRDHGQLARIEVGPEDFTKLLEHNTRLFLIKALKNAGYTYISLDLEGYRTGAMNETLKK